MHNKKLIAKTLLLTATLAASLTACGNKTASQTPGTEVKTETTKSPVELDTEAATKKEEVTTEAVTEAPTEAVTEVQTEAVVEEVTEAPAEAPVEVVEQPVVEAPEPVVVEGPAPPSGEPVEKPAPITNTGSLTVYKTEVDKNGKTQYCYNGGSIDISKVDIPEGVTYKYTSNAAGPLYEFYYGDVYVTGTRKYWAYTEEEVYGQINRSLASQMQWLRETGKIK